MCDEQDPEPHHLSELVAPTQQPPYPNRPSTQSMCECPIFFLHYIFGATGDDIYFGATGDDISIIVLERRAMTSPLYLETTGG